MPDDARFESGAVFNVAGARLIVCRRAGRAGSSGKRTKSPGIERAKLGGDVWSVGRGCGGWVGHCDWWESVVNDWKSCGGMVAGEREPGLRKVESCIREPEGVSEGWGGYGGVGW